MTAIRFGLLLLALALGAAACGRDTTPAAESEPAEPPMVAATIWSERSELFMEYPPLVAGEDARFAIHLTQLADFSPVREGRVVVRFEGDTIQRFETEGPSTPGIFGVDVKVPAARRYQLVVELHGGPLSDELRVGAVTVHPDRASALAAMATEEEGATAFLKEQQWTLDFGTMAVPSAPRRAVTAVPATIEPRAGGSLDVHAPTAGRIATGGSRPVGARVNRGETLVELIARNERVGEAPILKLEVQEAEARLRLAEQDRARIERLANAGAVPARRLAEARTTEETAAARLEIAREHLRHLELSRSGEGSGSTGERVVVRASISGVVAEAHATPGATVEEGALLYRIVAVDRVHVVGRIPEQHVARAAGVTMAEVAVPGIDEPIRATRLVTIGRVVHRETRSVPIVFELDNPPAAIAVGQAVSLRLIAAAQPGDVSVPATAIVDDGGQPIVFVQTGGESFERRPVTVGSLREGGFVQVVKGLEPGERIVTKGAHLVRLAALSPQTPGHGHVH